LYAPGELNSRRQLASYFKRTADPQSGCRVWNYDSGEGAPNPELIRGLDIEVSSEANDENTVWANRTAARIYAATTRGRTMSGSRRSSKTALGA
jgi:hypothetical protein